MLAFQLRNVGITLINGLIFLRLCQHLNLENKAIYRVMPTFSVYRYLVVMMLGVGDCDGDVRWLKGGGGNACIVSIVVRWLCLRPSACAGNWYL